MIDKRRSDGLLWGGIREKGKTRCGLLAPDKIAQFVAGSIRIIR